MNRLYETFRRVNRSRRPEAAPLLRLVVLGSVCSAVLGVLVSGAAPVGDAVAALLLLPVGAWLSYRRREHDNTLLKLALTVGAGLVLWRFFGDLRGAVTIDDTREPLASLFLGVQVLHGFDLPQRRDLGFTLASSLTLVALAGTSTHAGLFGLLLVTYIVLTAVALVEMQRSAADERADVLAERSGHHRVSGPPMTSSLVTTSFAGAATAAGRSGTALLRASGPVLLVGLLLFLVLPRSSSTQLAGLPFSGFPGSNLPSPFVSNPGLDAASTTRPPVGDGTIEAPEFSRTSYFGFAEYLDLRTVGQLSDDPVLRVRADRARPWRGMVFDVYTGLGWTRSAELPEPTYGQPVRLQRLGPAPTRTVPVVQTFELLADTPNLVFAAGEPRQVYLAGGSVSRWDDGTISTAQLQEVETVYSVVSEVIATPPEVLRTRDGELDEDFLDRWTQLPAGLPQRVHELAAELTADAPTPYRAAEAVEGWLAANTEYTLEAPAPPPGGDLVDHFLFGSRQGWCEPIAASMVVLLRAAGVPARFATGFQPGDRNPISGVYDVALSDAHAWVEVFVPDEGWVSFDPTGAVPTATTVAAASRVPLLDLVRLVVDTVRGLVPDGAVAALASALRGPAGALAGLLAVAGAAAAWQRRRRVARTPGGPPPDPFGDLVTLAGQHGIPREAWQTPREFAARMRLRAPHVPADALDVLVAGEERQRYAPHRPPPDRAAAWQALARVRAALVPDDGRH